MNKTWLPILVLLAACNNPNSNAPERGETKKIEKRGEESYVVSIKKKKRTLPKKTSEPRTFYTRSDKKDIQTKLNWFENAYLIFSPLADLKTPIPDVFASGSYRNRHPVPVLLDQAFAAEISSLGTIYSSRKSLEEHIKLSHFYLESLRETYRFKASKLPEESLPLSLEEANKRINKAKNYFNKFNEES